MSKLTSFYLGNGTDHVGRTLEQVLAMSYEELEETHDYIQWLFPLREPSMYSIDAPILTDKDVANFRSNAKLLTNLQRAFAVMLSFYGFQGDTVIIKSRDWQQRHRNWHTGPFNHNLLRMTRILKSLTILGCEEEAKSFLNALEAIASKSELIGPKTLKFWREAVEAR